MKIEDVLDYYQKDIDRYEKNMKNYTEYQQKTTFSKNHQRYKNHKLLLEYIADLQRKEYNNSKAIEYIRNNIADIEFIKKQYNVVIYDDYVETTINDIKRLLNILQGSDKDE